MDGAAVFLKQVDPTAEEREGPAVSACLHVDLYSQGEKTAADVSNLVGTAIRFLMPFVTLDEGAVRMDRNRASESFRLPERTGSEIQIVRVPFHPFVETGRFLPRRGRVGGEDGLGGAAWVPRRNVRPVFALTLRGAAGSITPRFFSENKRFFP